MRQLFGILGVILSVASGLALAQELRGPAGSRSSDPQGVKVKGVAVVKPDAPQGQAKPAKSGTQAKSPKKGKPAIEVKETPKTAN